LWGFVAEQRYKPYVNAGRFDAVNMSHGEHKRVEQNFVCQVMAYAVI
jgi:hypothetical protein